MHHLIARSTARISVPAFILSVLALVLLSACDQATGKEEKPIDIGAHIREHYPNCNAPSFCGELVYLDCHVEVDGPAYYLDFNTGKVIGSCGGMLPGCVQEGNCETTCPPKEWTCDRGSHRPMRDPS